MVGTCVNRSVEIRDLNTIWRDRGLITVLTLAVPLSALSLSGDTTSVKLSVEKTGNGLFKAEMTGMRFERGRALSREQSLSEMRMRQCEFAGRRRLFVGTKSGTRGGWSTGDSAGTKTWMLLIEIRTVNV